MILDWASKSHYGDFGPGTQILSTFSRTLPDITGSDLLKSLQEGMNTLIH